MPATNEPRQTEVRVFISSTFRDMHAERDHLVTVVFPELRERVEKLGLDFFDVDLRWGVPEKNADGEKANSWEYCRQWIDRVEPFFVCILGQRYGWVPAAKDFKSDEDKLRQESEPRSITDLEVRRAVLDDRKKRRSYFYLRETEAPATATEYVDPPPLSGKLEQLKNDVRACGRPVRDYPCEWTDSGFTGMDEFGRRVLEDLWSGVLRDERYVIKDVWLQALGTDPDADTRYTNESEPVPREVWEKIISVAKPEPKEPLDAERDQMAAFATARLRWFQGRTEELEELMTFIRATDENAPRLAVIAAQPGQGKSALLAKLSTLISDASNVLITHFVGATERSSSAHALVERLLGELDRSGIVWPENQLKEGQEPKRDFNSLCLRLAERLRGYSGEPRIVILVDALNQLSDGHDLQWLPTRLGLCVRLIVSCVEDATAKADGPEQRVLHALALRQTAPLRIPLGPLTEGAVRTIVIAYLKEYCHELDREHLDALSAISQARNPLYLLVMLNELRTLGGNDLNRIVPARIAAMPKDYPDVVSLFRWVLQRQAEGFGVEAVKWWCLYLAHGRVGMASHELADLLTRKLGGEDAAATALRIERGLRRYLQRRGGQLDYFHGQLRQAVFEQYQPQVGIAMLHSDIASSFRTQADPDRNHSWMGQSVRSFVELPFHLAHSDLNELARILFDFNWIQAKTDMALVHELVQDYDLVSNNQILSLIQACLVLSAHVIEKDSTQLASQLTGRLEVRTNEALKDFCQRMSPRRNSPWLRFLAPSLARVGGPLKRTIEVHSGRINGLAVNVDGRLAVSVSDDHNVRIWDISSGQLVRTLVGHGAPVRAVAISDDGQIVVSGGRDHTLRVWEAGTGATRQVLKGHRKWVNAVALSKHGREAVSGASDHNLKVWDLVAGKELRVLNGHGGPVWCVALSQDGRIAASGSADGMLAIWDVESGRLVQKCEGHIGPVWSVAVSLDGTTVVSGGNDKMLRLWEVKSGRMMKSFEGHREPVFAVAITSDGRLVSGSGDGTIRIWNETTGDPIATLSGHASSIRGLALSAGSDVLVSGSTDCTLKVWDVLQSPQGPALPVHDGAIVALALSTDGRVGASRAANNSVKVWTVTEPQEMHTLHWTEDAHAMSEGGQLSVTYKATLPDRSDEDGPWVVVYNKLGERIHAWNPGPSA